MSLRELHNSFVIDPNDGGMKYARDEDGKMITSDSTFHSLLPPHLKQMSARCKIMCGCECCISAKAYILHCYHGVIGIWNDSRLKAKILKAEGLVRKHITYIKHIKIQWCHMEIIFMPKHQIWQILQCAHILSMSMQWHTGNVYCGDALNVLLSIFLTKKQLKDMTKKHPQLGFTFTTSLDVVLLMVEFHWKTRTYVTCVNKNLYQINLQKYAAEKS